MPDIELKSRRDTRSRQRSPGCLGSNLTWFILQAVNADRSA